MPAKKDKPTPPDEIDHDLENECDKVLADLGKERVVGLKRQLGSAAEVFRDELRLAVLAARSRDLGPRGRVQQAKLHLLRRACSKPSAEDIAAWFAARDADAVDAAQAAKKGGAKA
jgi:hypothetical protein